MTLWTPDGEHPVNRTPEPEPDAPPASGPTDSEPEFTPEQEAQAREMARQMADARAQLLEADPADIVANHAMGLYELAAIHITAERPDLSAARLAIDALATLVEGMVGRLGEHENTLIEALQGARMGFVQRAQQIKDGEDPVDTAADRP